jgi:hypothetical protein
LFPDVSNIQEKIWSKFKNIEHYCTNDKYIDPILFNNDIPSIVEKVVPQIQEAPAKWSFWKSAWDTSYSIGSYLGNGVIDVATWAAHNPKICGGGAVVIIAGFSVLYCANVFSTMDINSNRGSIAVFNKNNETTEKMRVQIETLKTEVQLHQRALENQITMILKNQENIKEVSEKNELLSQALLREGNERQGVEGILKASLEQAEQAINKGNADLLTRYELFENGVKLVLKKCLKVM